MTKSVYKDDINKLYLVQCEAGQTFHPYTTKAEFVKKKTEKKSFGWGLYDHPTQVKCQLKSFLHIEKEHINILSVNSLAK